LAVYQEAIMSMESNHGAAHGEGRDGGARMPTTFAQASRMSDKSTSWWRGQARAGRFRVVRFGDGDAIPADEWDRISREGLPPLPRRSLKGEAAA
jgi:hypothetical protein